METTTKALSIFQSAQASNYIENAEEITTSALTEEQRKGRELYLFSERNERNSLASQIYANLGLACLGIRRLLQACYIFIHYSLLLTFVLGSVG